MMPSTLASDYAHEKLPHPNRGNPWTCPRIGLTMAARGETGLARRGDSAGPSPDGRCMKTRLRMPARLRRALRWSGAFGVILLAALCANSSNGALAQSSGAELAQVTGSDEEAPVVEGPVAPTTVNVRSLSPGGDHPRPEKPYLTARGRAQ